MSLAGLILAGGASTRMGRPKALLPFPGTGETFADRLIGVFSAYCPAMILVLGCEAEAIRAGLRRAGEAMVVVNPDYERGQLSSLKCGLRAVPAEAAGVLFTPVDYPAIAPATVARLAEVFGAERPWLAIPRHRGRRGHPVCCARELIGEFLAAESQAREVIHRHIERTRYVDVDDPGILQDIDDPEAYRALAGAGPLP